MNYTAYLRYTALGILVLVPFISFIVASGGSFLGLNLFFPYITGKNFVFRILVELLLLVYLILAIKDPQYRPKASWLFWSVTAFVAWVGIATIFSVDPVKSFWSNFERMEGYITLIHLFALFVVAGAVLTVNKWWERFFQITIAASVIMGFFGVMQLFNPELISTQSGSRLDTTFGNATYLAVYMLIHVFLTLFLLIRERKSQTARWLYGTALVLQVVCLFFTETRGAALGLVGGLIIMGAYIALRARGSEWTLLRKVAIGGLLSVVLLAGLFFALKDTSVVRGTPMLSRLASISLDDPTTMSRFLHIWPMAIQGGLERPLTGWGQENFNYVFNKNYSPEMYSQEQWFDRAHNQFLDWFVAAGVPAFLLYIALFVLAAWAFIRSSALSVPEQGALLGLLAAYGFNNLFVFDNIMSAVLFYLVLAFAHSLSLKPLPRWIFLSKPASDQMVAVAAPILAIVILGGTWVFNAGGIARAQELIHALTPASSATGAAKDPKENLASFKRALEGGPLGKQETVEQLFQFASNGIAPSTSVSPEVKEEFFTVASAAGKEMLASRPNDARLELFMGVFYNQFGQTAEALRYLTQAQEHSPNKQQILFQVGITHLQRGDVASALPVLKKAFDLEPSFGEARMFYAMGLYFAERDAEADAVLIEGFGTVLVDDNRLLQIYTNIRRFDRVIGIWNARLEKSPESPDLYLGLAGAQFAAGNTAAAIAALEKVAQLNPAQAAQMQSLISQIRNGTLKPQ